MDDTTLYRRLALMSDAEAQRCLQGLLGVATAPRPELRKFYGTEPALADSLAQAARLADPAGNELQFSELGVKDSQAAIRMVLVEIASDKQRRADLVQWLDGRRETLFEPVTTALVLAGIVFVLQLDVDVKIENGKLSVRVKKTPTDATLLKKFFSLFS